jgi:protein required for attachment to host cells
MILRSSTLRGGWLAPWRSLLGRGGINALVVVAPPRTLAELRDAFHTDVKAIILAEINKDLTNHPIGEIERLLTGGN